MFKDILINQFKNPNQSIDESEIYLDLISTLSEREIKILFEYRVFAKKFELERNEILFLEHKLKQLQDQLTSPLTNVSRVNNEILEIENTLGKKTKEFNALQNIRKSEYFQISNDRFLFFIQRLWINITNF